MTPDWNDAPSWAQWVAMDSDGHWWWFASKPTVDETGTWYAECGIDKPAFMRYEPVCLPRPDAETGR